MEFFKILNDFKEQFNFVATGADKRHVLNVLPQENSPESIKNYNKLLAILSGTIFAGTVLIYRSLQGLTNSQVLGVHAAAPFPGGSQPASTIALFGFCMQANRGAPNNNEKYHSCSAEDAGLPQEEELNTAIDSAIKYSTSIFSDYTFLEDKEQFILDFTQAVVWVITDDIGFIRCKKAVFNESFLNYVIFNTSCIEIMLSIQDCRSKMINKEDMFRLKSEILQVLDLNKKKGFLGVSTISEWEIRFAIKI